MEKRVISMRHDLAVKFTIVSVLIATVFGVYMYNIEREKLLNVMHKNLEFNTRVMAESVDNWINIRRSAFESRKDILNKEGTIDLILQEGLTDNSYLRGDVNLYGVETFYIALAEGVFIDGADWIPPEDFDPRERVWYQDAVATGRTIVSETYLDQITGERCLTIASPFFDGSGEIAGVLGTDIIISDLTTLLNIYREEGTETAISDSSGTVLADNSGRLTGKDFTKLLEDNGERFLKTAVNQTKGNLEYSIMGSNKIIFFDYIPSMNWLNATFIDEEFVLSPLDNMVKKILGFTLMVVAIYTILIYVLSHLIAKRISVVSTSLQEISNGDGDLTRSLPVTKNDELTLLARNFNIFQGMMNHMIGGIKKSADSTLEAKDQLLVNTEETAAAINEISANMHSIESQIQKLDNSINISSQSVVRIDSSISSFNNIRKEQAAIVVEASAALDQMIKSLKQVDRISREKKEAAGELTEASRRGSRQLNNLNEIFNRNVVSRLKSIEEMTHIIRDIASQTNLLSMNAAIEAAHAGDAGKGFAVVAEEIRKLAEVSSHSVKTIDVSVKEIHNGVEETLRNTGITADIFNEVNTVVDDFVESLNQIAGNTNELVCGSQQLISTSTRLNELTTSIKDSSDVMITGTMELKTEMANVGDISKVVYEGIQEAVSGSREIVNAMDLVKNLSGTLAGSNEQLKKEIDRFKINDRI